VAASVGNRAPAVLRRREQRCFSSASDDEVGGPNARDARAARKRGQGRNRTGDLSLFRRTLLPTELPGLVLVILMYHRLRDPDGTRTRDLRRDRAAR
jgi:hypothetical protein